jgi:uncharacterized protein YbjQ (UPF0145 family)
MSVLVTTTPNVEGYKITKYLGLVCSNAYYDNNGYSNLYSAGRAWEVITDNVRSSAERMGADAVVGLQITSAGAGEERGFLYHMLVQGTAVKLERIGFDDELPDL